MKLTAPYSFASIADPNWFLADLYAVRNFYNGLIDDYNVKDFAIMTGKVKDGEINGSHFVDYAVNNTKFKSSGHNPATADKIQSQSIGSYDMRADTGADAANNVKGLWTPSGNTKKVRVLNGVTPGITLDTSSYWMSTENYSWSDILTNGNPGFSEEPTFIFTRAIGISKADLTFITETFFIRPFDVSAAGVSFLIVRDPSLLAAKYLPDMSINIGVEVWDIGGY